MSGYRNTFQALSQDHKPELESESQRILSAGGFVRHGRVNGSLSLSRAIGDYRFKRNSLKKPWEQLVSPMPDVTISRRQPGSFLIMACDGVWECVSQDQLMTDISRRLDNYKGKTLTDILENTFDQLVAPSEELENGQDNMSAILLYFK